MVFDGFGLVDENHIFSDIRRQIADAFEVLADHDKIDSLADGFGVLHHVGQQGSYEAVFQFVNVVVPQAHGAGFFRILLDKTIQDVLQHILDDRSHVGNINQVLQEGHFSQPLGPLRDIYGMIAHSLQVIVYSQDAEKHSQINSHGLIKGHELDATLIEFNLHSIDLFVIGEHFFSQLLISLFEGLDRFLDNGFHHGAHNQKLVFQSVQFFVPRSYAYPNRPVM
jgi:hypothetical protein